MLNQFNLFIVFQDGDGFVTVTEMRQFFNMLHPDIQVADQDLRKVFGNAGKIANFNLAVYLFNNNEYK